MNYNITLQNSLNLTEVKIRAVFDGWTDGSTNPSRMITLDNDVELFALFKTQYYFQVTTDMDHLSYVHGTGWYDSGTEANYFLDPSIDIRSKFDHWERNVPSDADETPSGHLSMDGPKVIIAKWREDFTYFTGIAGSIAVLIGVGEFLYKRHTIIPILSRFINRRLKKE